MSGGTLRESVDTTGVGALLNARTITHSDINLDTKIQLNNDRFETKDDIVLIVESFAVIQDESGLIFYGFPGQTPEIYGAPPMFSRKIDGVNLDKVRYISPQKVYSVAKHFYNWNPRSDYSPYEFIAHSPLKLTEDQIAAINVVNVDQIVKFFDGNIHPSFFIGPHIQGCDFTLALFNYFIRNFNLHVLIDGNTEEFAFPGAGMRATTQSILDRMTYGAKVYDRCYLTKLMERPWKYKIIKIIGEEEVYKVGGIERKLTQRLKDVRSSIFEMSNRDIEDESHISFVNYP